MTTNLTLPEGEIHVWSIDLQQPLTDSQFQTLTATLQEGELARADRFHFPRDREAFFRSRAVLRQLTGSYLNTSPDEINFSIQENGKPELFPAENHFNIQFNVSHTRGMAVIALVKNYPVGIDIETCERNISDANAIARRFFTSRESQQLLMLGDEERRRAFFRIWTQKEAYLKATGEGISNSLNKIEVAVLKDEPFGISEIHGSKGAAQRWTSLPLDLPSPFIGTVTLEGPELPLRQMQFQFE